jgi:hypothetical protein
MILAESYTQLVTDVPHIMFEATYEVLSFLLVYPFFRLVLRRFGKGLHKEIDTEHGIEHGDPLANVTAWDVEVVAGEPFRDCGPCQELDIITVGDTTPVSNR